MTFDYHRTIDLSELWSEVKPYMDDGGWYILYGDEAVNNAEAVVCFNPESMGAVVFPVDPAPASEARRWDAFWRICNFVNRRADIEHGRRF